MNGRVYSERLGVISDEQFQMALDHFNLGRFIQAQSIPFGNFGQNVFVSSTQGEYVLRGNPHFWWQFPTEQFFTRQLCERSSVPVPWPYLIDSTSDIFGWNFVIMPRMSGLQLEDSESQKRLGDRERRSIARALGENLASMQQVTWPIVGRYNAATDTVEPFELAHELAHPFSIESNIQQVGIAPTLLSYSERVQAVLRQLLARSQARNPLTTTPGDIFWVKERIAQAQDALNEPFEPCLLMEDYKEGNLVVTQHGREWRVSGVFDLMGAHFGDGEADLSRPIAEYLNKDPQLAYELFDAYRKKKPLRPGFAKRFPIYMLLDRAILWEFFQWHNMRWWDERWTFRNWASQYISPAIILDTVDA